MNEIRKILLVSPPVTRPFDFSAKVVRVSTFFPLGIAYLAGVIEKNKKYRINVLDALVEHNVERKIQISGNNYLRYGMTDSEIAARIHELSPDVVGVSCLFAALQFDAGNLCRIAKSVNPKILTVLGGAHAGACGNYMLKKFDCIDSILIGESEESFLQLLDTWENKKDLSNINGIIYRNKKQIIRNEKNSYIHNLDKIPFPARHLFDMKQYLSASAAHSVYRNTPFTQMVTSRGCPCKCTFCALGNHWGPIQRMRSAKNVLDEIEYLIKNYGIREIHFEDDNLTGDKDRAIKIFDGMIERGFNISWNVPSGMAVYTLDIKILEKMKASGCYSVSLAIESGNQQVLSKLMHKPVDLKKIPALVKDIRNTGMDARGFFILGYPDETKETIQQTIDFARHCELDWSYFFIASPLPSTKMWDLCLEKGYFDKKNFDPVRSFHTSIIKTPEFDPTYLARIREEAIVDVNFRNNPNLNKYDIDKAIENFEDVVSKYPHFDFANYYLGEAFLKKGNYNKALFFYQGAIKANPNYDMAKQRITELNLKISDLKRKNQSN